MVMVVMGFLFLFFSYNTRNGLCVTFLSDSGSAGCSLTSL